MLNYPIDWNVHLQKFEFLIYPSLHRLNSLTKNIEMSSKGDLSMQSKYSQMNLDSLKDLNVNARKKIILDSKFIQLKKLNKNQAKAGETLELHSQVRSLYGILSLQRASW